MNGIQESWKMFHALVAIHLTGIGKNFVSWSYQPSQRREKQAKFQQQEIVFMIAQSSSGVEILSHAIINCQSQSELTECALKIHLVSAPHSDDERALILKVAAMGISLEMRELSTRSEQRRTASEFERN